MEFVSAQGEMKLPEATVVVAKRLTIFFSVVEGVVPVVGFGSALISIIVNVFVSFCVKNSIPYFF